MSEYGYALFAIVIGAAAVAVSLGIVYAAAHLVRILS